MEIHIILGFCVGVPAVLSFFNFIFIFAEKRFKPQAVNSVDIMIFGLGIPLTMFLIFVADFKEWYVQLPVNEGVYTPISYEAMPTIFTLSCVALVGYILPRFMGKKLSPIIAALCYGAMFIGVGLTVAITIQLLVNISYLTVFLLVLPWNYVLCSIRLMRNTVSEFTEKIAERTYDNRFLGLCKTILNKSASFMALSFFMMLPLLFIIIIILTLFGQQPDSIIKAFTETAEWTLSQKIPPPRLDYAGHYLCTVAACGDEKIVKPIRAGKRQNRLIIVNRQLLIANAFEDLIAEKTPKLHRIIRKTYDKLGLPISKYITTKRRSNIVYFIMKPLEWIFLLILYTLDIKPENRIHKQYLG